MADEKEFFGTESIDIEMQSPGLKQKLSDIRDKMMQNYSQLIATPNDAPKLIMEMRSMLAITAAVLMEHDIKLNIPERPRQPEDVLKEAAGELGSMFGVQGVAAGLSFVNKVKDQIMTPALETLTIYEDEDGNLYYIDHDGNEVDCDEQGNALGDDNEEEEDDES